MTQRSSADTARKGDSEVLRVVAEALAPYLREYIHPAEQVSRTYYSQLDSPLGRRRYLDLVHRHVLCGKKLGRLVLVRRDELHAYIEAQPTASRSSGGENILEDWGLQTRSRR